MDKKFFSPLVFLLSLIVSGCGIPQKITGPTWTTKLTLPLIERTMANGGEIRLDGKVNGLGEPGFNLVGINLHTHTVTENWQTDPLGFVTVTPEAVADIDLEDPEEPKEITVNNSTSLNLGTTYADITLSPNYLPGVTNDVAINLSGCTAAGAGLNIKLLDDAGNTLTSTTIQDGETVGHLALNGCIVRNNLTIWIEGPVMTTGGAVHIGFSPSKLELAAFTLDGTKVEDLAEDFGLAEQEFRIDLGTESPAVELANARITLTPRLPRGICFAFELILQFLDGAGSLLKDVIVSTQDPLADGASVVMDLTSALNEAFMTHPQTIRILLTNMRLTSGSDQVTVSSDDVIGLEAELSTGLHTAATRPQSMTVQAVELDVIKEARLHMECNNTSPVGLTMRLYLSHSPTPKENPELTHTITIDPNGLSNTVFSLTGAEIAALVGGTIYHQLEIVNTSEDAVVETGDYLEVRAYAQAEILVNDGSQD